MYQKFIQLNNGALSITSQDGNDIGINNTVSGSIFIDARNYPRCYMGMINDCEFIARKVKRKGRRKIDMTPAAYYDKNNNKLQ